MNTFGYKNLDLWFKPKNQLFELFKKNRHGKKKKQRQLFFDNGGKVLLVAHIDTVIDPLIKSISKKTVHASGLDDRLGCAIGYWMQQHLPVDLLICDYEESGASTAQYHSIKKSYNFIVELDRGGGDFVTYDGLAENAMIDDITAATGMVQGWGSFSDICFMNCKGIAAVNWGVGYFNAHSRDSYAPKKLIQKQIKRLWGFIETFQDRPYKEGVRSKSHSIYTGRYTSTNNDYDNMDDYWRQRARVKSLKYSTHEEWYKQPCDWCSTMTDVALMENYICASCQKTYPTLYHQRQNNSGYDQCIECQEWVDSATLAGGLCADCYGLFDDRAKECECDECGSLEDNDGCVCNDGKETFNVMLDGNEYKIKM